MSRAGLELAISVLERERARRLKEHPRGDPLGPGMMHAETVLNQELRKHLDIERRIQAAGAFVCLDPVEALRVDELAPTEDIEGHPPTVDLAAGGTP